MPVRSADPLGSVTTEESDQQDDDEPPGRVRRRDLIATISQLAILVESGVTLTSALAATIEEEKNSKIRLVLKKVKQAVEGGQDFSTAISQFPQVFNPTFIALAKAGEKTGALGAMLRRAAAYLQAEHEIRAKIRSAMIYPTVMLIMAVGVTGFLLTFVLPRFVPVFEARHATLPRITVIMLGISSFFTKYGLACLGLVGIVFFLGLIARKSEKGRRWLDSVKLRLPLLGNITKRSSLARSIRTLGTLLASGIPVLEAMELAADIADNCVIREAWLTIRDGLIEGKRICDCMKHIDLFPKSLIQMVAAGEETGKLDLVLDKTAEFYEKELETTIKTATSLIEPAMIIVMGVVVGTIGLSLLLPIFSLSRPA